MSDVDGSDVAGGILWDDVQDIISERLTTPITAIAQSLFGVIGTGVDLVRLLVSSTVGTGAITDALDAFSARLVTEAEGFSNEIGEVEAGGIKAVLVSVAERAGVHLDPDEPLSAESISEVVSQLVGYDFENVFDRELLRRDLLGLASQKIEERTGVPIDLEDEESIGNFAAALLIGAVEDRLPEIDVSAICPAVNTVASVLCKVQNCHPCMDDEEDCKERRDRQKRMRSKYERTCVRSQR